MQTPARLGARKLNATTVSRLSALLRDVELKPRRHSGDRLQGREGAAEEVFCFTSYHLHQGIVGQVWGIRIKFIRFLFLTGFEKNRGIYKY